MLKSWPDLPILSPPSPTGPVALSPSDGPYRHNVAALVIRDSQAGPQVLLGERLDTPGAWQWPQGGVDPGESAETALHREVWEEIGVRGVQIRHAFPFLIRYLFPVDLAALYPPYVGQEQWYFVVTLPPGGQPDPHGSGTPEFARLDWFLLSQAPSKTIWFKKRVYAEVLAYLQQNQELLGF